LHDRLPLECSGGRFFGVEFKWNLAQTGRDITSGKVTNIIKRKIIVVIVKILSLGAPERYAVRRLVAAAYQDILLQSPDLELETIEVSDPAEIGKYAFTIIQPTLVINEKIVCSGRFPTREEVLGWLGEAVQKK
jgi:hypothetical protein